MAQWEGFSSHCADSPPDCRLPNPSPLRAPAFGVRFESRFAHRAKKHRPLGRCFFGAVGGIRTLVPLLTTTRFPVVLVMTTSIPLHFRGVPCVYCIRNMGYYTKVQPFVKQKTKKRRIFPPPPLHPRRVFDIDWYRTKGQRGAFIAGIAFLYR